MSLTEQDRPSLRPLEARLLRRPELADCALVTEDGTGTLLAYLVPAVERDHDRLRRRVAAELLEADPAARVYLVDGIPRTHDGEPDTAALAACTGRAPDRPRPARVHLRDLDPSWRPVGTAPEASPAPPAATAPRPGGTPAIAVGDQPPAPAADDPTTLPEALLLAAERHPERGLHLVRPDGTTTFLPYPELLGRARRLLGRLNGAGLRPGDRAILEIPDQEQYFPALWACLLGGIQPVTVARPPGYDSPNPVLEKLCHAWETLEHPPVLAAGASVAGLRGLPGLYPVEGLRVIAVDEGADETGATLVRPAPADVAMLQLSSGSTGRSKAVRITHRGIMEYVAGARLQGLEPGDTTVNWLPLDHVAGLLMFHLRDVVLAADQVQIPTHLVLGDPLLWLDVLERHRAAHSWSPNFGLRLVAEAVRAAPGRRWDLSALKSLINAGEQCTAAVVDEFLAALAPSGVRPDAVLLGWGMAETCTAITYKRYGEPGTLQLVRTASLTGELELLPPGSGDPATPFLSMGRPAAGARMRIADEHGATLPERRIGRLQVSSGRVTPGYLNNPAANREAFVGDGWFDTGDLAYLSDGEVVLTGRRKEIIIINGVHHFCHELEDIVATVDGVLSGHVAACGVPDARSGSEQLVVFFVPQPGTAELPPVVRAVRAALAERFRLAAALVLPVPTADFPRTTSGKIQRTTIRGRLLAGAFDDLIVDLDLGEGNARTLPDCVRQLHWQPRPAPPAPAGPLPGTTLLVGPTGPDTLSDELAALLPGAVQVGRAPEFTRAGGTGYAFDPTRPGDWAALFAALDTDGRRPDRLIHLWSHTPDADPVLCGEALLTCVQALTGTVELTTVSTGLHALRESDRPNPSAALTAALTAGFRAEELLPGARHIDLPAGPAPQSARDLLALLADPRTGPETAWRDGRPWVPRLGPATTQPGPPASLLTPGARYLVTGGLGGVAEEILPELLRRYGTRLLIIGRTDLQAPGPEAARRREALERLSRHGGRIRYATADVTDGQALGRAVAEAEQEWGQPLDGVLHLATGHQLRLLEQLTPEQWRDALRAKTEGTDRLVELVRQRPGAHLIGFSSMIGLLDAVGSTAYAAANRYLETALERLHRETGTPVWTICWGLWSGIGVNRETSHDRQSAERGIAVLTASEGRRLAPLLLAGGPGRWYAGPDPQRAAARRWLLSTDPRPVAEERPASEEAPAPGPARAVDTAGLRRSVLDVFETVLGQPVDPSRPFHELGIGSLQLMRVHAALSAGLDVPLPQIALFQHPTVDALVAHLGEPAAASRPAAAGSTAPADRRVAIVGMALRLPGADTPEEYWHNIAEGICSTTRFTPEQLAAAGLPAAEYTHPDFVPVTGALGDIGGFDAELFGISGAEAALMDPQQRLLLEICHQALEDGGYGGTDPDTRVGVFAGTGMTLYALRTYLQHTLGAVADPAEPVAALQVAIGNQADFAATRVSYRLGLTGPAIGVQTACSTSLVAVHLAVQSLLAGDTDLALAGSAALHIPQAAGYRYEEGSILSRDGVCRAFDAGADGTVGGNGVAAVLLKRLDRALADGDTVHAVILGSAVNNDGASKVGYTAPSVAGQAAVVGRALDVAGVPAESIGYLETHGTGTPIGDPIEVQALTQAYRARTDAEGFCALGSVKPNIGHLDTCAGLAGLIKAALVLRHRRIPPLANFSRPNPALGLAGSPFRLPTAATDWAAGPTPRRAGVSALGVGGTNAHLVLEEPPAEPPARPPTAAAGGEEPTAVLPLSARTADGLAELARTVRDRLRADPGLNPADLLLTLGAGRRPRRLRLAATGRSTGRLADALDAFLAGRVSGPAHVSRESGRTTPTPVMLFTGQGAQYRGMAAELYRGFPVFRSVLDTCDRLHRETWGEPLLPLLLEAAPDGPDPEWTTEAAQPALFAVQAAYTRLWAELGVRPAVVAGHSAGEYAAFHAAGALDLADGLFLASVRGRLMHRGTAEGAMTAVHAGPDLLTRLAGDLPGTELAVVNGAGQCVLAGPPEAVESAEAALARRGLRTERLAGGRAFHSRLLEPMLAGFRAQLERVRLRPLRVPLVTNLGGAVLAAGFVPDAEHFVRQTRETARFDLVLDSLGRLDHQVLLEVGPHNTLTGLGRRALPDRVFIPSGRRGGRPGQLLATAAATLWAHGAVVDWAALARAREWPAGPARRIPLPTQPFQRKHHWFSSPGSPAAKEPAMTAVPSPVRPAGSPSPAEAAAQQVLQRVVEQTARQLGLPEGSVGGDDAFFDLGADSLSMINIIRDLERTFHVRVSMRELFESADTPHRLGALITERLSPETVAALAPTPAPAVEAVPQAAPEPSPPQARAPIPIPTPAAVPTPTRTQTPAPSGDTAALVNRQLDLLNQFSALMSDQLTLLSGSPAPQAPPPPPQSPPAPATAPQVHGPRVTVARDSGMASGGLTPEQRGHLDGLVSRFTARTAASKAVAQRHRRVLADSRAVVGFRSSTKEMLYPIASRRARGSRLEDIDGNSYIDITMGFGVLLFGHEPDFVDEAVREHLSHGLRLGPRGEETGEAAELLAELTGMERVAFANSGTEANSGAIRLARAFTGRDKVVMFEGSYHGHFDNTLGRTVGSGADRETVPVSSGIPGSAVADLIVLRYGDPESLRVIEELSGEIAAVLVEPVQSRHPSRQPKEFVRELRELTARRGIVLVFDEMLTGFRPHLRGAQGFYGVKPDLATYGKVLGGGFPIGAIAGSAAVMDGIDGGHWQYGDDSYPPNDTTFFGGTYIQHPVSMAAARAVLRRLKAEGPALQDRLNARTDELASTLNRFFEDEDFPVRLAHFGSLFRFEPRADMELLFHHLLVRGVYVWEWRNFFLSTAHSDGDVEFVADAVRESLRDMRRGGFFPSTRQFHIPAPRSVAPAPVPEPQAVPAPDSRRPVDFSLYFFGDYPLDTAPEDKYTIVLDSARFADRNGFHALWLPERHFHSFGGIFPNPSVLAAALARETERIRLNAGCAVLPLHHPVRVAEEWSVVDNLSGGRVGIGCASGWHPNDFLFFPERYGTHKELMHEQIDTIRSLWRGEPHQGRSGNGEPIEVRLHPRPLQAMPPMYTAIVGNPDSFRDAARHDLGVITNLMTQSVEQLAENVALYRRTRAEHGLDPEAGRVVVLVHTYLGTDLATAREQAYRPFCSYLRASLSLFGQVANSLGLTLDFENTPEDDLEFVLERAYERYCESRALIGTPESSRNVLDDLRAAGADEIACFVDFGLSPALVRQGLPQIDELRRSTTEERRAPLSYAQQRMWFLHRMLPDRSTYNEVKAIALDGPLDTAALDGALRALVERHPMLRTVFREQDGEAYQLVLPGPDGPLLEELDRSGPDAKTAVRELVAEEGRHRFDLTTGPLFRARLLQLAPEQHVLVLCMHHIVIDTLSAVVITRELGELYRAAREGRPSRLPVLTGDYAGYAAEQRAQVAAGAHKRSLEHWLEVLGGDLPVLALPTDRPRPTVPSGRGEAFVRMLPAELSEAVRGLARSRRSTLFMVLLAAFAGVLHRFSGQDELVLGTPVANRDEGSEDLVGFFVNTLALRLDLSGEPGFEELLARVRSVALDAYEHQELPFEVLVQELNPERDTSRNPLFQVMVEFENHGLFELDLPEVTARPLDEAVDRSAFDLAVFLTNLPEGIRCHVEYATDLFGRATVDRLFSAFEQLLAAAVADPSRPVARLLTPSGSSELSALEYGPDPAPSRPVLDRVTGTASAQPAAPAVVAPDGSTTSYAELLDRSARLAAHLHAAGIGPGDRVAVLLPRSVDLVAALLAVVRLGAVHLPLDPTQGTERLRLIAEDSEARLMLTDRTTDQMGIDLPALLVEDTPSSADTTAPFAAPDPDAPAYCLYTSGSTGRPKGVLMPYRALTTLIDWNTAAHPPMRTLQYASCGFDVSIQETLTTLSGGGTLFLIAEETRYDASALAAHVRDNRIERIHLPYTPLGPLVDALGDSPVPDLKEVISGGEQLLLTSGLRPFLARNPQCRLINHYGPTETHGVTACEVSADGPDRVPIGRPVPGTRLRVLDRAGRPVPAGAVGELCAYGPQVALGYQGRPDETARAFLDSPEGRYYRTGDLARWRPDGHLEFLGRADQQVKIRGYRIEPGEIETVLRTVPGVEAAAVTARQTPDGTVLAGHVVLADGTGLPTVQGLLAELLPEHMVPRLWAAVAAIPFTVHGKLDQRALPAPAPLGSAAPGIEPATELERQLHDLWAAELGLPRLGVETSFFDLGGHSLTATRLVNRVREATGLEIGILDFFRRPTVRGMAALGRTATAQDFERGTL